MGNSNLRPAVGASSGHQDGFAKFSDKELGAMERMFRGLAARSPGKTVSKTDFLKFFNVPGLLGERLFEVFDSKQTGVIDFEEFVTGLATYSRGSMDEKIRILFRMFDLDGQGAVLREELRTMLYSAITPAATIVSEEGAAAEDRPGEQEGDEGGGDMLSVTKSMRDKVEAMVKSAFDLFDKDRNGRLSLDEFSEFTKQNPQVIQTLEVALASHVWQDDQVRSQSINRLKQTPESSKRAEHSRSRSPRSPAFGRSATLSKQAFIQAIPPAAICPTCSVMMKFCPMCSKPVEGDAKPGQPLEVICIDGACSFRVSAPSCVACGTTLHSVVDVMSLDSSSAGSGNGGNGSNGAISGTAAAAAAASRAANVFHGYLFKKGQRLHRLEERWYVLRGNFFYVFKSHDDLEPYRVHFVDGCFIEPVDDGTEGPHGGPPIFGFCITFPRAADADSSAPDRTRVLYAATEDERNRWVELLRRGCQTVAITSKYRLGRQIGRGHFSHVHEASSVLSGKQYAIKIIEKKMLDDTHSEALRSEIAVMKLMHHPNIIHFKEMFETPNRFYIVMNLARNGDLFDRIIAHTFFKEPLARLTMWKIVDAVRYLHARGIVHRDLKPENILCDDPHDESSILISDFGLSKFASPSEVMRVPCGTLAYVAPEVLRTTGYGRSVDVWSIGCISHLILCGFLPFDGQTKQEIIHRTLHSLLDFTDKHWAGVSGEAKDFVSRALDKNPKTRAQLDELADHAWFAPIRDRIAEGATIVEVSAEINAALPPSAASAAGKKPASGSGSGSASPVAAEASAAAAAAGRSGSSSPQPGKAKAAGRADASIPPADTQLEGIP